MIRVNVEQKQELIIISLACVFQWQMDVVTCMVASLQEQRVLKESYVGKMAFWKHGLRSKEAAEERGFLTKQKKECCELFRHFNDF